tara:strand:- start:295 stop:663 length:369 start_codon:yes stop_codon:yes gene_type:complete
MKSQQENRKAIQKNLTNKINKMNDRKEEQNKGYKQVKIQQRITMHKYVEVFVNVPTSVSEYDVEDWMWEHQSDEISDRIQNAFDKVEFESGSGFYDYEGLEDLEDIETRFQVGDYGGHTYCY